ncbi:hypothetical protein QZH41_018965, partial [Actinostola sp. cb2023]
MIRKFIMTSSRIQARNVELTCSPLSANVDKKVRVNVRGLAPNQKITLQTKLCGDVQDRYRSLAHYIADNEGRVCLNSQPSVGGSYVGVEPMGFIWSLKPEPDQRPGRRLMKRDVTKPYLVDLEVLDGHIDQIDNSYAPLCSLTIERHYMGVGVRRVTVHEGRIWGTLFLPPGDGPFQGVIDLIGSHGGLVEFKAALLASNGFAAFTLAYLNYEDLPVKLEDLDLEYFLEAVDWFKNHPQVIPGGVIDLIGSHGGLVEFKAALLAANGFAAFTLAYLNYEDLPVKLEDLDLEYFLEAVDWFKNHPQVIPGGVIDLIGSHGGMVEFKAALLASNGFAAFTLAYLNYEDLPDNLQDLDLEYFLEAVDWFKNHPQVIPG